MLHATHFAGTTEELRLAIRTFARLPWVEQVKCIAHLSILLPLPICSVPVVEKDLSLFLKHQSNVDRLMEVLGQDVEEGRKVGDIEIVADTLRLFRILAKKGILPLFFFSPLPPPPFTSLSDSLLFLSLSRSRSRSRSRALSLDLSRSLSMSLSLSLSSYYALT